MAKNRCSNSDAIRFIEYRDAFETNNKTMFGEWHKTGGEGETYAVYSYGHHFPMYVWDAQVHKWYGNKDKYSRTTSSHQTKARPRAPIEAWYDTDTIKRIAYVGIAKVIADRMEKAYE